MEPKPSAPMANPIEESGTDYLQTHHIPDLFHNLSASLVYNRPGMEEWVIELNTRGNVQMTQKHS